MSSFVVRSFVPTPTQTPTTAKVRFLYQGRVVSVTLPAAVYTGRTLTYYASVMRELKNDDGRPLQLTVNDETTDSIRQASETGKGRGKTMIGVSQRKMFSVVELADYIDEMVALRDNPPTNDDDDDDA